MNTENKLHFRPSYPWHLFVLIITTVFAIAVSLYCINVGWFNVFQNLFYFPIIFACIYYLRKGFVFSVLLTFYYLFLVLTNTSNSTVIRDAFIRVAIFIMVAGVVLFLSLKQKRLEEALHRERIFTDAVFNSVPGILYLYNDHNKLVRWNKKHKEMTGYSSEELLQMGPLDWFKGDENSIASAEEGIKKTFQEGFGDAEAILQSKNGTKTPMYFTAAPLNINGKPYFTGIGIDITERKRAQGEREQLINKLQQALADIKTLKGLIPICANCKKIRDDNGYWNQIESYISKHSEAVFSHGICPDCAKKLYPELVDRKK